MTNSIDLGQDLAIAEIKLGLIERSFGFVYVRLGLLNRRRLFQQLGINAIQIVVRVAPIELSMISLGAAL